MRILFLCGCLERGRDGVGDYTRRLGGELLRQGYEISLLALNDKYATNITEEYQESEGVNIEVLRIPEPTTSDIKFTLAKEFIHRQNPEWISLQYVLFAFNNRGLPFGISRLLKELTSGRKLHIMFHELWVGMEVGASRKFVFWGWLQKQIIFGLVKNIQPTLIHTHTPVYQKQLGKAGIVSQLLPLFSNIPVGSSLATHSTRKISFVIFGSIHTLSNIKEFAKEVALFAINEKIDAVLVMLGRCGDKQKYWLDVWRGEGLEAEILGEQPPEIISEVLKKCTFGISTTPLELIEKSGTVAAMREHGLPIISIASDWKARGLPISKAPKDVFKYKYGFLKTCITEKSSVIDVSNVYMVSKTLLNDLKAYSKDKAADGVQ
jgi:hypothetical protein